jgi:hypothetical protein
MKKLKKWLYMAGLLCMSVSCKKEDRTTVVFGKVTNDINQPIEGVEMVLYGEKGILGSRSTRLKSTLTDAKGEYTITTEIPTDYHSGSINCEWFRDPKFYNMYTDGALYFNGQQTQECCPLRVGTKSQYDFGLVRK